MLFWIASKLQMIPASIFDFSPLASRFPLAKPEWSLVLLAAFLASHELIPCLVAGLDWNTIDHTSVFPGQTAS